MKPLKGFAAAVETAIRVAGIGMLVCLVFLVLLIFAEIVLRFVASPIPGEIDIAEFTMAALAFLGLGYAQLKGAHVRVDAFISHLPPKLRRAADVFDLLLTAAFLVPFIWLVAKAGYLDWQKGSVHYGTLQIPLWIRSFSALIGLVGLMLAFLVQVLRRITGSAEAGT